MRMSCNGCRVLRKGCRRNCSIRPCLKWIKNPESQANATLFLSKFYGRAGLLNLINSGPEHLRPAMFRSLLYEACGRMVNPIYGSVGLMWTGKWSLCEAEVTAVLDGAPINKTLLDKACTIRHKDPSANHTNMGAKRRTRVRRSLKPEHETFEIFSMAENNGSGLSAERTMDRCLEKISGACIDLALGLAPPSSNDSRLAGCDRVSP